MAITNININGENVLRAGHGHNRIVYILRYTVVWAALCGRPIIDDAHATTTDAHVNDQDAHVGAPLRGRPDHCNGYPNFIERGRPYIDNGYPNFNERGRPDHRNGYPNFNERGRPKNDKNGCPIATTKQRTWTYNDNNKTTI